MVRIAYLSIVVLSLSVVAVWAQEGGPPAGQPGGPPAGPPPVLMLEGDVDRGAEVARQVCAECHGETGHPGSPAFPRLAGQIQEYLAVQTWLIREGIRPSPLMAPMVAGLDDQQLADAAAYFAAQTPTGEPFANGEPAAIERGAVIFNQGNVENGVIACAICHGRAGEGMAATGIPRISGQSPSYLTGILGEFAQVPDFGDPFPNAMHIVASALGEEDMNAVVNYLASRPWGNP